MFSEDFIKNADPELWAGIEQEMQRQESHIELIASENFVSKAVMAAMGDRPQPPGRWPAAGAGPGTGWLRRR